MPDLEQWKKELQLYYNDKYFMSNPDNWQELANTAVERDYQAEVQKRNKSNTLPEVTVTAKRTPTYTRVFSPEWSTQDIKDANSATKAEQEASKQIANSVRNKMNDVGNAIGSTVIETGSSFTPFWFVVPTIKAGASASEGNYKEAAKEAATGLLAPYAIGKGIQYGIKGYRLISPAIKNYRKVNTISREINNSVKSSKLENIQSYEVPLENGYLYHTTNGNNIHPAGWNGKKFKYIQHEGSPGALDLNNGSYVTASSRRNPNQKDYIWWDINGHNNSKEVYVTKRGQGEQNVLQNLNTLDINSYSGRYEPGYYVTEGGISADDVIKFKQDPISRSYVPHMPNKVLTNKQTIDEIFNTAPVNNNYFNSKSEYNYLDFFK